MRRDGSTGSEGVRRTPYWRTPFASLYVAGAALLLEPRSLMALL